MRPQQHSMRSVGRAAATTWASLALMGVLVPVLYLSALLFGCWTLTKPMGLYKHLLAVCSASTTLY